MRSLAESKTRWDETLRHSTSFADLQWAVKFNGPDSPCLAGCRSVCWKAFLLFHDAAAANWSHILLESRNTYSTLRDHYLKYIKHPEQLAELSLDPLADDPESPWDAFRRDEIVRAEILQDVRRLPDEPFYHLESTQTLILDILFIYCKLNPDVGGYRQGMHELLAPIVYVVDQDAIDRANADSDSLADPVMVEMLDSYFVEHDAFALFSKIMEKAKGFYEISSSPNGTASTLGSNEQSAIVEMSKQIHEITLMRIDPELGVHLKNIEVLPQIFLIRWIRLLFGREFPFDQLLVLWDTIFAFDPTLDLIPLVCVAMLIRIRWTLLEADYSVALQLLLKYPAPQPPHGPHTFVDDAVYLKDHMNTAGGANLILKYTGKPVSTPVSASSTGPRPSTPTFAGLSLRPRTLGSRSPLPSPARFIQNRESVEALFQGAAKGVIQRGEKLGINQAVRDAMDEIRKNVQGFQESRNSTKVSRDLFGEVVAPSHRSVAEMERRNRQLAAMLDETVTSLKSLVASNSGDVKSETTETIEMAAARIQFVKVHLEDSSLSLPEDEPASVNALSFTSNKENVAPTVAVDTKPVVMTTSPRTVAGAATSSAASLAPAPEARSEAAPESVPTPSEPSNATAALPQPEAPEDSGDRMETDSPKPSPRLGPAPTSPTPVATDTAAAAAAANVRPNAPIPTRSTLAQSSFSWMLEPDVSPSSSAAAAAAATSPPGNRTFPSKQPAGGGHRKRPSSNASRERNAFLFGEVISEGGSGGGGGDHPLTTDEIFGLEPLRKALPKPKGSTG